MALLFKGGEQLFNEAIDAVGRKDYNGARKKFQDALQKGYGQEGLTETYIALIDVIQNRSVPGTYRSLLEKLNRLACPSFRFGLTEIDTADLRAEVELDIKEIEATSLSDNDYEAKGQSLIGCAGEFLARIGEKNLKLDEISKGTTAATGSREALVLQAQAYAIMGKGKVHEDPKVAAEYLQISYNFRKQLGDDGSAELKLSQDYSRAATCWICGRPANGEGIHFYAARSTIEPVFQKMTDSDVVKPISQDCRCIFVCTPCYTAISNRSEEISKEYYDAAISQMRAMEARLQAEISALRFNVSMRR